MILGFLCKLTAEYGELVTQEARQSVFSLLIFCSVCLQELRANALISKLVQDRKASGRDRLIYRKWTDFPYCFR